MNKFSKIFFFKHMKKMIPKKTLLSMLSTNLFFYGNGINKYFIAKTTRPTKSNVGTLVEYMKNYKFALFCKNLPIVSKVINNYKKYSFPFLFYNNFFDLWSDFNLLSYIL